MQSCAHTTHYTTDYPDEKVRVLVVDDDAATRLIAQHHFSQQGYEVALAENGEAALNELERFTPQFILMDAQMPKMDGFSACKAIASHPSYKNIPVFMATSLNAASDIDKAFAHGAYDYLEKPVNFDVLVHRAKAVMDKASGSESQTAILHMYELANAYDYAFQLDQHGCLTHPDELSQLPFYLQQNLSHLSVNDSLCHQLSATFDAHFSVLRNDPDARISKKFQLDCGNEANSVRLELQLFQLDERGFALAVNDISMHRRAEEQLKHLAHRDPESELPNLLAMMQEAKTLEGQLDYCTTQLAVVSVEVRGLDWSAGEADENHTRSVAQSVCSFFTEAFETDAIRLLARSQANRFDIILHPIGEAALASGMKVLDHALDALRFSSESPCSYNVLVGAAHGVHGAQSGVKGLWQDCHFVLDNMGTGTTWAICDTQLKQQRSRQNQIARYLKRDLENEQLSIVFQPKYCMNKQAICGFEVLSRWQCDELGMVSPGEFVPVAVQHRLSTALAQAVIKKTLNQMRVWQEDGLTLLPVSINLDGNNLSDLRTPEYLIEQARCHGIDHKYLEIEVTENLLVTPHSNAVNILHRLRELGFRIAMDDFGTEYSSLSQLRNLPIDVLKIDRSFVCQLTEEPRSHAIVRMIIGIADELGISVVAEGVEEPAQRDILHALGCDVFQGYLHGKPDTPENTQSLLSAGQ